MRHWSLLGIRNWRVKPGRAAGAVGAIALGVGVVVWVTCAYESVRMALRDQMWLWVGRSHLSVESKFGANGTVFHSIAEEVQALDNVLYVTAQLKYPMQLRRIQAPATTPADLPLTAEVQAVGIEPLSEYHFRDYDTRRFSAGSRSLEPDDRDVAMMEALLADQIGLKIGDRFELRTVQTDLLGNERIKQAEFTLVGIFEHRRVARQQPPVVVIPMDNAKRLAQFEDKLDRVTKIDVILQDSSSSALRKTERELRQLVNRHRQNFMVTSAEGKLRQAEAAERHSNLVMLMLSSVALFTAFFIILSTLSMGMVERIEQLGTLRCLGVTRWQMAFLMLSEAVPLGMTGMILGIPVGLLLARLSVWMAPQYIGQLVVSYTGILLALSGGAVTTLAGAGLPALQAMRVSPLSASRPQSKPAPAALAWLAAMLGAGMIVGHVLLIERLPVNLWVAQAQYAILGVTLLYCGYALLTPLLIRVAGWAAVYVTAAALRLRYPLLSDQVGRAPWRSAAICSGLMVGLSLIVSLLVYSKSLASAWDFPRDFAEAFVFVDPPISPARAREVRTIPGVSERGSLVNEGINCTVYGRVLWWPFCRFIVGDPDEFFELFKVEFVEGEKDQAIARLREGGAILVTPEFTRATGWGFGEQVPIRVTQGRGGQHRFEIAGVVTSPSLQMAANYFNIGGELTQASIFGVLGTFADAKQLFGIPERVSLYLINFDLEYTEPPSEFYEDRPPLTGDPVALVEMLRRWQGALPERAVELHRIIEQYDLLIARNVAPQWDNLPLLRHFAEAMTAGGLRDVWRSLNAEQRWEIFRENLVMILVASYSGAVDTQYASVRGLKMQIDRDLRRATLLLSTVPLVALLVAALGVGNLMMTNVTARRRQIATLRALGATRWQVVRLVVGEALVLGVIGSLMGVLLGGHAAHSMGAITGMIWGFQLSFTDIPWSWVALSIAFTLAVCLIAGLMPARNAAQSNVINALQTT
ncbi:MAG: ABC transporter permease [Phycisphaerales bacterium]|nr:ABC transporter permease [Phycisphaerales bacterium]